MSSQHQSDQKPPAGRRVAWIVTVFFAVLILIPSMLGFVMKFMELIHLTQGETDGGFAITPVINYLLASAGFFCLLLWAAINGMFNDLEQPKFQMLANEAALDADSGDPPENGDRTSVRRPPHEPPGPRDSSAWKAAETA